MFIATSNCPDRGRPQVALDRSGFGCNRFGATRSNWIFCDGVEVGLEVCDQVCASCSNFYTKRLVGV